MAAINTVNFVRRRRAKVGQYQQLDKRLFQGSLVVLGLCLVALGSLFGYWRYLISQDQTVMVGQQQQQQVIAQSVKNEAEYLVFTTRLTALKDVITNRRSKKKALDFLAAISRPQVSFANISFIDKTRLLTFRAKAGDVTRVEDVLSRLREPEISNLYTGLTLDQVTRDDKGIYTIDITITLKDAVGKNGA